MFRASHWSSEDYRLYTYVTFAPPSESNADQRYSQKREHCGEHIKKLILTINNCGVMLTNINNPRPMRVNRNFLSRRKAYVRLVLGFLAASSISWFISEGSHYIKKTNSGWKSVFYYIISSSLTLTFTSIDNTLSTHAVHNSYLIIKLDISL